MKFWSIAIISLVFAVLAWLISFSVSKQVSRETIDRVTRETSKICQAQASLKGEILRLHSAVTHLRKALTLLCQLAEENLRAAEEKRSTAAPKDLKSRKFAQEEEKEKRSSSKGLDSVRPLSEEEKALLKQFEGKLKGLPFDYLLHGDLYGLLEDPKWNPEGKELTEEERQGLRAALEDYRFYHSQARSLIHKKIIRPEMDKMREEGAYIEYKLGETPPVQGVPISVAEPAARDGKTFRLFLFYPEDYPELYELEEARKARAKLSAVRAFLILRSPEFEAK